VRLYERSDTSRARARARVTALYELLRVLSGASAARVIGVDRLALIAAARDERSPIVPHAVEVRAERVCFYFVEETLRAQVEAAHSRRLDRT